jgi:phospholipid/cholesterol/gamma-HCH transport system substrate-binding protein
MSDERNDWLVGLFVLIGAIALAFLALRAGNLSTFSLSSTYTLSAKFDNIGGLKVRAPVKSAGVVVGRVSGVEFDGRTFQAVVTLQMEKGLEFPQDSSARILTSGLLGEQYIGLEPGGDDTILANGGEIRMTQSAIVLESLISKFLFNSAEKQGTPGAQAPAATDTAHTPVTPNNPEPAPVLNQKTLPATTPETGAASIAAPLTTPAPTQ